MAVYELGYYRDLVKISGSSSSWLTLKIRFDKISFVENTEDKILELNELIKELDKKLIVTKKEI